MNLSNSSRLLSTIVAIALVMTACSSSDEPAEAAAPETADTAAATTSTAAPTTAAPDVVEPTTTTVDNRTDEEKAIDQLDLMLVQLRTVDLIATADCVVERLESEGIEIVGQGAPEMVAALGCDPGIGTQLFGTASFGFTESQSVCVVGQLTAATAAVPLEEAEAFFSTPTPPDDVLAGIASVCDVPLDELQQGFN